MKKHENYPNKADFEPNVDKHGKKMATFHCPTLQNRMKQKYFEKRI